MDRNRGGHSRRDVLRTAAAAGATGLVASVAGCQQVMNAVGLGKNRTKQVPGDAENAFYVDVQAAMDDEGVKALTNAYLSELSKSEYYEGPDDYEAAKEQFQERADLDPSKARWQISFSEYNQYGSVGSYYGTIFKGKWNEDDVVNAYEQNYEGISYDEEDYEGKTIYEPSKEYVPYVGVISNNKFVSGPKSAVEDAIDVAKGNGDKMDKELRKAYGKTKSAPVRYVSTMTSVEGGTTTVGGEEVDTDPLTDVERVAGSVYKNGDKRGTENMLFAGDKDAAGDVADMLQAYFSAVEDTETGPEALRTVAGDVTVEHKGKKAVVTYEAPVDELKDMVEQSMNAGDGGDGRTHTPTAQSEIRAGVDITCDGDGGGDDGEIAVTWTSNANAERLLVATRGPVETDDGVSRAQLSAVGDSVTFSETESGENQVDVTVLATRDGEQTVVSTKTCEL